MTKRVKVAKKSQEEEEELLSTRSCSPQSGTNSTDYASRPCIG